MKLFLLVFVAPLLNLQAQTLPANFKPLTISEGLPHTDATCVTQDNNKFLWFGTLDGLCRYDGYEMKIYRHNPSDSNSISNNRILCLANDSQRKGIWAGTQSGGLNFFNYITNTISVHQTAPDNNTLSSNQVNTLFIDSNNTVWVGTNKGLNVLQSFEKGIFKRIHSTKGHRINSIYEDKAKRLWIGTDKGLFILKENRLLVSILDEWVNAIVGHSDTQKVFVGTGEGLFVVDIEKQTADKLNPENSLAIYIDENNLIWIGSGQGIYILDEQGKELAHYTHKPDGRKGNLTSNKIRHFYKDSFNTLWISTIGGGLSRYNAYCNKFITYPKFSDYDVKERINQPICFAEENNELIWIGTKGNGLALFNRTKNSYRFIEVEKNTNEPSGNFVTALHKAASGSLWVGTMNGLFIIEKSYLTKSVNDDTTPKFLRVIPELKVRVNRIYEDRDKNMWIATYAGLYIVKHNGYTIHLLDEEFEGISLSKSVVTDILIDYPVKRDQLTVWVGTQDGLNQLTFKYPEMVLTSNKVINNGIAQENLPSDFISFIHKDKKGDIWIGTLGGGLNKLLKQKNRDKITFQSITISEGLLTNDVETLLEDGQGNFWIGGHGLLRLNPISYNLKYYNVSDGLQSNSFKVYAAHKLTTGEMIFGGINGFNMFDPLEIKENPIAPQTVFTNLYINNKIVEVGQEIDGQVIITEEINALSKVTIPSKFNNFSIEFAGIQTASPEKELFKFKLDRYDEHWVSAKSNVRSASYAKLPPGNYFFKVTAANGDGVWDPSYAQLEIEILPTFWESIYGYILYTVLIILAIYFFGRYSIIKIGEKTRLTIERYRVAKELETYQHKLDFFTNVSHEIRTPLTLILTPVEQLIEEGNTQGILKNKLSLVYKNANRLKTLVDQLLDFRKLEDKKLNLTPVKGNVVEFIRQIYLYYTDYARVRNISFQFHCTEKVIDIYFDQEKMEQVFYNIITNAFKFTPQHKTINITVQLVGKYVAIAIANEGSYISKEESSKIFDPFYQTKSNIKNTGSGLGLALAKYVTDLHQGNIYAKSSKRDGVPVTTFYIELPLEIAHRKDCAVDVEEPDETMLRSTPEILYSITDKISELENKPLNTKSYSLLIVEDNFDLRTFLKEELKNEYNIYEADNGRDGLKIAQKKELDLVLTDVMLPNMDGINLCKEIKTKITTSHLPVFILTARDTIPQHLTGLKARADDYMTKPFNISILKIRIRNLIENREKLKNIFRNETIIAPGEVTYSSADEIILEKAMKAIEENMENPDLNVLALCREVGMSRPQLYRKIKALTGLSINAFINTMRLKRAAQLLKKERYYVSEVIEMVGFSSPSYFNRAFKAQFGCNPKDYKQRAKA